jgi:hypothetical protein
MWHGLPGRGITGKMPVPQRRQRFTTGSLRQREEVEKEEVGAEDHDCPSTHDAGRAGCPGFQHTGSKEAEQARVRGRNRLTTKFTRCRREHEAHEGRMEEEKMPNAKAQITNEGQIGNGRGTIRLRRQATRPHALVR